MAEIDVLGACGEAKRDAGGVGEPSEQVKSGYYAAAFQSGDG
jgi:hypothetical protein